MRPEVQVTSDEEVEFIGAGPAVLHVEGAVIRVQFTLVLLTAAHLIQGELLHTLFAIVAAQEDLYQFVHCCAVRNQKALVLGLQNKMSASHQYCMTFMPCPYSLQYSKQTIIH